MTSRHPVLELWKLVRTAPRRKLALLIFAASFIGITEGFGIIMVVPLLETLGPNNSGVTSDALPRWMSWIKSPVLSLKFILFIFVALTVLRAGLKYIQSVTSTKIQHTLVDNLRYRCFDGLLRAEWRWMAIQKSTDQVTLLITNISRVGTGIHQALALAGGAFSLAACLIAAFILSWKLTLLAVLGSVITMFAFNSQRQQALQLGEDLSLANRATQNHIQEGLAGIRQVKIMRKETTLKSGFSTALATLRDQQTRFIAHTARNQAIFQIAGAVLIALFIYVAIIVLEQNYTIILPLVIVFTRIVPILNRLEISYHHWLHAIPALSETYKLLSDTAGVSEPLQANTEFRQIRVKKSLKLNNISFTYANRPQTALNDICITFKASNTTAIIGPSGSGKSTLADIITGLLAPDQGSLTIDGHQITDGERQNWRKSVAYLQQDSFLFNDSIRNNFMWAFPSADERDIQRALKAASADFVYSLDKGLDTIVGDNGVLLSGGERQRIALARALLSQPSILILDEATSALDPDNEAAIHPAISNLHGDITIIMIGHRLSMLDNVDQIIELRGGRVHQSTVVEFSPASAR